MPSVGMRYENILLRSDSTRFRNRYRQWVCPEEEVCLIDK